MSRASAAQLRAVWIRLATPNDLGVDLANWRHVKGTGNIERPASALNLEQNSGTLSYAPDASIA
jgi:hypothetical protein